jgi:hypothetical protein
MLLENGVLSVRNQGRPPQASSHSARERMRTVAHLKGSRGWRSVAGTSVQHCRRYLASAGVSARPRRAPAPESPASRRSPGPFF